MAAEQQQQEVSDYDRRHDERHMDDAVEHGLAPEAAARQQHRGCQTKRQAADHCASRDAQTQPHRFDLPWAEIRGAETGGAEIGHRAHPTMRTRRNRFSIITKPSWYAI